MFFVVSRPDSPSEQTDLPPIAAPGRISTALVTMSPSGEDPSWA
ncbi:hypothetical protein Pan265_04510 [Mucisphaera calidilacus]|uniref:Uncharacterized protein n=1 Tax=Mucisphaera calidilacus TaxID=2527982 RepID=A0A518BUE9_9BACT|nr:hypothetical protein Pan265_04510 [Mucisphaera calidilacus]